MYGGDRTFVARDLSVFSVPTCEEDGKDFVFRQFAGYVDSTDYRGQKDVETDNPFSSGFEVDDVPFPTERNLDKGKVGNSPDRLVEDWADISGMVPAEDRN